MDRERRRQAVVTAGFGVFLTWMSSYGRQMMIDRDNARIWLTGIALLYLGYMDPEYRYIATNYGSSPAYYGPGFEVSTYMHNARGVLITMVRRALQQFERVFGHLAEDVQNMFQRIINSNAIP